MVQSCGATDTYAIVLLSSPADDVPVTIATHGKTTVSPATPLVFTDANGALGRKEALYWARRFHDEWDVRWFEDAPVAMTAEGSSRPPHWIDDGETRRKFWAYIARQGMSENPMPLSQIRDAAHLQAARQLGDIRLAAGPFPGWLQVVDLSIHLAQGLAALGALQAPLTLSQAL